MTLSPRRPFVRLVLASALVAGLWGCHRDRCPGEPAEGPVSAAAVDPEGVDEVVTMLVREAMRAPVVEPTDGAPRAEAPERAAVEGR